MLRFHTQTAGCSLTAQQPFNNVVRVAVQALAAILGGTQSLHTNSYDEAYATPSEEAVTTALRTQQILAYESGVADSADPLGGSWMVECLTRNLEEEARRYIDEIDSLGGALSAIEKGFPQREIQESSYRYQREVEEESRLIVGVNRFVSPYPKIEGLVRVNPEEARKQVERLNQTKQERNSGDVASALENLKEVARSGDNTMPAFIGCVEAYATIGEICDTLREVFGVQRESLIF
jgi:methylmalonyl-CoA mutase N-terminal domain/subunit